MLGLLASIPILFAQAAAGGAGAPAGAAGPQSSPSFLVQIIPFLPMIPLFYFLMIRPQQQAERKRKSLLAAIKKNDKVLTLSGIYGTVVSVDVPNNRVVLRVDDDGRVKIPFTLASIGTVLEAFPDKSPETT